MENPENQPALHPLQAEANEVFYGWALDHERESEKSGGVTTAIRFDPVTYPEQLLDVPTVPILDLYNRVDEELFLAGLHENLAAAMGDEQAALNLTGHLRSLPTSPENKKPLAQTLQEILTAGESVAVIFGHQIFMDMGFGVAAITEGMGTTRFMDRNVVILNKAMAYEKFNGHTYTELTAPIANMVFVSPKTESARQRNISERLSSAINFSAGRAIREFGKRGAVYFVALHGTSLKPKSQDTYLMPAADPASGGLIQNCRYILRFALAKDPASGKISWNIGPLEELETNGANGHERRQRMRQLADDAQLKLARQMANLLGKTVEVEESRDRLSAGRQAFRLIFPGSVKDRT
jgi:hypothetical protein